MRLNKTIDKVVAGVAIFCTLMIVGVGFLINAELSFADVDDLSLISETGGDDTQKMPAGGYYVNIYDAGERLTVKAGGVRVREILERVGVELDENDRVEPGLDEVVDRNNYYINIYRARPVLLKDGSTERYFMTASYDFRMMAGQAGIVLYDGDEVRPLKNTSFLEAGAMEVYEIVRNGGQLVTEEQEIPYTERREKDYSLAPGTEEIRQEGENGVRAQSYRVYSEAGVEVKRELVSDEVVKAPVERVVAVGASKIEQKPLTPAMGRNRYTVQKANGATVERQETFYDLDMSGVMRIAARECGAANYYTVREDGVKVDAEGYVLVAANLSRYPRCTVVETSLGMGRVYDTGSFAVVNPEQFDIATDWTNRNGR